MAKEYTVERAFRQTVSKEDKTPKTWKNKDGAEFQTWMVKVTDKPFWFQMNKKLENEISEGDTIYGVFDEEEKTNKATGEKFTVNVFNRIQRTDGSRDKVQSRGNSEAGAPAQADDKTKARLERLEKHLGLPPIEFEDATVEEEEETPFNPNDLPL